MRDASDPDCRAIGDLLGRIGDKWTALVVGALGERAMRYSELRRENPGISQRMLTLTLRNLERDGLVSRTVTPVVPPRVDYALTVLGRSLLTPVTALARWALDNVEDIHGAQRRYDARQDREDVA